MPSTASDAEGLLRTSIHDDNPVVFVEHRALYYQTDELTSDNFELGRAQVHRPGDDVTVIATGRMVRVALEAAEELAAAGIHCEVVDAGSLPPLDVDSLPTSVRRRDRAVIARAPAV